MKSKILEWFGFGGAPLGLAGVGHGDGGAHGHTHGVIDASLTTTDEGLWAIKWSFIILAITAAFQLTIVFVSGSVALLADTIHNIGDATTAIPLWAAFVLARRKPSATFTYGLGRVEDLAGILIVLIILASAIVAGYEAIDRLIHPQPIVQLGWLTAAGIAGFVGNEVVAVFRIRVAQPHAYGAQHNGQGGEAVRAGVVSVGYQRCAVHAATTDLRRWSRDAAPTEKRQVRLTSPSSPINRSLLPTSQTSTWSSM